MRPAKGTATAGVAAALIACGLVLAAGAGDDQAPDPQELSSRIQQNSSELADLRSRIEANRRKVQALNDQERESAAGMEHYAEEMQLIQGLLAGLDGREQILTEQSQHLQARLDVHLQEYRERQTVLGQRLRSLYMQGPQRSAQMLLSAPSFSSLVTRLKFATLLARLDSRLVRQVRQQGLEILSERGDLQAALVGIWEAREEAHQQRQRLEWMRQEHQADLEELQWQKREAERRLTDLRESEKTLAGMLDDLENLRRQTSAAPGTAGAGPASPFAGSLEWPATGKLVQSFGSSIHPEFKTVTNHNGISIATSIGAPVYAVAAGRVEYADQLPGFGVCVILDLGAGYYALFANLGRLFVSGGDQVSRGEIIAEVGESQEAGGAQLYFEIRQGKTPVDPIAWLKPRH